MRVKILAVAMLAAWMFAPRGAQMNAYPQSRNPGTNTIINVWDNSLGSAQTRKMLLSDVLRQPVPVTYLTGTNLALDLSLGNVFQIAARTNFTFAVTNAPSATNLTARVILIVTNTGAAAVSGTNVTDDITAIGNWGTFYPGLNRLLMQRIPTGWAVEQDTSLIDQGQIDGLAEALANINNTLDNRLPAFDGLTESTPSTSDRVLWWDGSAYRIVQIGSLLRLGGAGSFSYDISATGTTTTNEVLNIYTNTVPINTTRTFEARVLGAGASNSVAYKISAIVQNISGTFTIKTNQYDSQEGPVLTTCDSFFQQSGANTYLSVLGPTNGQNVAWKATGFVTSMTNAAADTGAPAYAYVLNDITNSVAGAWSLNRKLTNTYAGSAFKIRRSSDGQQQDIGFSGNFVDTAAISSFVGSDSAYLVTVYDQSGNGKDLAQTVAANSQPLLVNAGMTQTAYVGGQLIAVFDGVDDYMTASESLSGSYSYVIVGTQNSQVSGGFIVTCGGTTRGALKQSGTVNKLSINNGSGASDVATWVISEPAIVRVFFNAGGDESIRINNGTEATAAAGSNTLSLFSIGNSTLPASFSFSEAMLLNVKVDSTTGTEPAIQGNINAFYNLY